MFLLGSYLLLRRSPPTMPELIEWEDFIGLWVAPLVAIFVYGALRALELLSSFWDWPFMLLLLAVTAFFLFKK